MAYLVNAGPYTIASVRTFRGMETEGFNAALFRDGRKLATLINEGNGGLTKFEWVERGRLALINGRPATIEEARLHEYASGLPEVPAGPGDDGAALRMDSGLFVELLVERTEEEKRFRKMLKARVVLLEGRKLFSMNVMPIERNLAVARQKYPEAQVLNVMPEAAALALIFQTAA